jgi:benzoyl-CoA reductase/2-hydroxyglutaryl-CoA dehydratase subunit BcrC/BadD/HgdB
MGKVALDFVSYSSLMDFGTEFVHRIYDLIKARNSGHQQLIASVFPSTVDLIYASGAIPTLPAFFYPMGEQKYTKGLTRLKRLIGIPLFTKIIHRYQKLDHRHKIDRVFQRFMDDIFTVYNHGYKLGEESGISSDACYGIKVLCGFWKEKYPLISANLFQTVRCSAFSKAYESMCQKTIGIWMDIPPYHTPETHSLAIEQINNVLDKLSSITKKQIDQKKLVDIIQITNDCKKYSNKILNIAMKDTYPVHPKTFASLLAMIEWGFQDYLGNPSKFLELLKSIYYEFQLSRKTRTRIYNVRNRPIILLLPRFGGWDPIIENYVYNFGGRVIYADWFIYGFMNPISCQGNIIENYAKYLEQCGSQYGSDNEQNVSSIIQFIKTHKVDGVIFNQLFGCHSLSTVYSRLRKELLKEEIPSTLISFNTIGERFPHI